MKLVVGMTLAGFDFRQSGDGFSNGRCHFDCWPELAYFLFPGRHDHQTPSALGYTEQFTFCDCNPQRIASIVEYGFEAPKYVAIFVSQ